MKLGKPIDLKQRLSDMYDPNAVFWECSDLSTSAAAVGMQVEINDRSKIAVRNWYHSEYIGARKFAPLWVDTIALIVALIAMALATTSVFYRWAEIPAVVVCIGTILLNAYIKRKYKWKEKLAP